MAKMMILGAALMLAATTHASALVGPSRDETAAAAHTLMLLKRDARGSSFCTANVIAPDVLLTAGHCVTQPENLRAYWPGGDLEQKISAVAVHPQYRADATQKRIRSIDLALVRLARPLPREFQSDPDRMGRANHPRRAVAHRGLRTHTRGRWTQRRQAAQRRHGGA